MLSAQRMAGLRRYHSSTSSSTLFAVHFGRFEEKLEHRLAATKAELRQDIAGLRVEIHSVKADLIKWTFVFWAPVALAVIGLYFKT